MINIYGYCIFTQIHVNKRYLNVCFLRRIIKSAYVALLKLETFEDFGA